MKCNVGKCERKLRVLIGLLILVAGYYFKSWWGAIGLIPILTGLIGWCPIYLPIGINTCKNKKCIETEKSAEKLSSEIKNSDNKVKDNVETSDDDPSDYDDSQGDE